MTYSLLYTDVPTPSKGPPDFRRMMPVISDSMGTSINAACALIRRGAVVWQIKGSEGFAMERSDIEAEYWRRENLFRSHETAQSSPSTLPDYRMLPVKKALGRV